MHADQLEELKQVEFDMLEQVVRICNKYHIRYCLGDGSLLGAVRHKGFIPWDDDIDVLMFWKDYKRFIKVAQKELGDEYFLQTSETDKNWYRVYGTIRKNNTSMVQNPLWKVNQGIWLDIFLIGNARSKLECRIQRVAVRICNYLIMDNYMKSQSDEFKKLLTPLGYSLIRIFYKIFPYKLRYVLRDLLLEATCSFKGGDYYPEIWCAITDVYDKEVFKGKPSKVEFEGKQFLGPHNPHLFLKTQYGEGYMTPVKWERGHENIILDFSNSFRKYLKNE